jgi:hypothetical protein
MSHIIKEFAEDALRRVFQHNSSIIEHAYLKRIFKISKYIYIWFRVLILKLKGLKSLWKKRVSCEKKINKLICIYKSQLTSSNCFGSRVRLYIGH